MALIEIMLSRKQANKTIKTQYWNYTLLYTTILVQYYNHLLQLTTVTSKLYFKICNDIWYSLINTICFISHYCKMHTYNYSRTIARILRCFFLCPPTVPIARILQPLSDSFLDLHPLDSLQFGIFHHST